MTFKVGDHTMMRVLDQDHKPVGWMIVSVVIVNGFMIGLRLPTGEILGVDLDYLRTWQRQPELIIKGAGKFDWRP